MKATQVQETNFSSLSNGQIWIFKTKPDTHASYWYEVEASWVYRSQPRGSRDCRNVGTGFIQPRWFPSMSWMYERSHGAVGRNMDGDTNEDYIA